MRKICGRWWLVAVLIGSCALAQFYLGVSHLGGPSRNGFSKHLDRKEKTVSFDDCHTFEDHRLGTVLGVLAAKFMQRAVNLPSLRINATFSLAFSSIYATEHIRTLLSGHHIELLDTRPVMDPEMNQRISCNDIPLGSSLTCMEKLKSNFFSIKHLVLGCPSPSIYVAPAYVAKNKRFFWEVMEAVRPSMEMQLLLEDLKSIIGSSIDGNRFGYTQGLDKRQDLQSLLHFNRFNDFAYLWSNSDYNTMSIREELRVLGMNYSFPDLSDGKISSILDYYIGLESDKSITNLNTTFGALLFLERRHKRVYAAGCCAAESTLLSRLPIVDLPWVFFHNTSDQMTEYMLKVAVKSAQLVDTVQPVCILIGKKTHIYEWLLERNVTVIFHSPDWTDQFYEKASSYQDEMKDFQLTREKWSVSLNSAVQIDIPIIDGLRQFDYVLYTTPTVLFRGRLTLDMFGARHPPVIQSRPGKMIGFPFGSSVVLWNVAAGLANYEALVAYVLDQHRNPKQLTLATSTSNLSISDIRQHWVVPEEVVSEAFGGYNSYLTLVDFSEMSPHQFAQYMRANSCPHNICLVGIFRGWCCFVFESSSLMEGDDLQKVLPIMRECYTKNCQFRGGCHKWKEAISRVIQH